jgi:hypothetical protein
MRATTLTCLILAAGLAGCAGSAVRNPAQTPAGMTWGYYETADEGAKLAYGRPESDVVAIMMTCPVGSGRVSIWISVSQENRRRTVTLVSGKAVSRLRARFDDDQGEGATIEGRTSVHDPVLQSFAATGELIVEAGEDRLAAPAHDPATVRRFLSRCND